MNKIETISSQIDELFGIVRNVLRKSVKLSTHARTRLGVLFLKMQDGVLDPDESAKLTHELNANKKALSYYVEFQHLTSLLKIYYSKNNTAISEDLAHAR